MIIYNFNIERITVFPFKTYSPLLIDANTMLPFTVAFQSLKSISVRRAQFFKFIHQIDLIFAECLLEFSLNNFD